MLLLQTYAKQGAIGPRGTPDGGLLETETFCYSAKCESCWNTTSGNGVFIYFFFLSQPPQHLLLLTYTKQQ